MKMPAGNLKAILIGWLLVVGLVTSGQPRVADGVSKMIDQINGRPSWQKLEEVNGWTYLSNKWNEGFVRFKDGQIIKNLPLKFNVKLNELYFQRNGQALLFNTLPSDFSFGYSDGGKTKMAYYRRGYPSSDDRTENSYYEVLADGKVQLLQYSTMSIHKSTQVAYSDDANNKYVTKAHYYLFFNGKLVPLILSKKNLLAALDTYRADAEAYMENNPGNYRAEEPVIMLINYLNTGVRP